MQTIKNAIRAFFRRRDPAEFFTAALGFTFLLYLIVYAIRGGNAFTETFFLNGSDAFMDFFNSIRDATQGLAAYTERHVIYPPMANLVFLLFSRFMPSPYFTSSFEGRYTWKYFPSALLLIVTVLVLAALTLSRIAGGNLRRNTRLCGWFALFAVINIPVLFTFERGNIVILSLLALACYAFTYDAENPVLRELGLLALAFSFSLKIYPALFGYFLLTDKRYKDAIRCAVYALLMLLLPSFFFGGPVCLLQMLPNTFSFSTSFNGWSGNVSAFLHLPEAAISAVCYAWVLIYAVCFLLSPLLHRSRSEMWLAGLTLILLIPSLTALYSWSFFLIPLIFRFNEFEQDENGCFIWTRTDVFYFVTLLLPFLFLPFPFNEFMTINSFLVYVCTGLLSLFIFFRNAVALFALRKERATRR